MKDAPSRLLYRSNTDRIIGGVAGGLGEYFYTDPLIFRLLFVIFTFAGGAGFFLYLLGWIFIPDRQSIRGTFEESVKANAEEIAHQFEDRLEHGGGSVVFGVILIVLGILFLFVTFGLFSLSLLVKLWPLFLILIGVQVFLNSIRR